MQTTTTSTPNRRPGNREVRAKRAEIKRRYSRKHRKEGEGVPSMVQRFSELERLFAERYRGFTFPEGDDSGLEDLKILAHTARPAGKPDIAWARWAPWATDEFIDTLAKEAAAKPMKWTAPVLGRTLSLTMDERTRLDIRTIAPIDCCLSKREALKKEKNRERKRAKRLEAGATPRELSAARTKPWEKLGISRATWFRRGKPSPEQDGTPETVRRFRPSYTYYTSPRTNSSQSGEGGAPERALPLARVGLDVRPSHSPRDDAARIGTVSKVRPHSEVNAKALGLVTTGDTHIKHLAWVFSKEQCQQFSAQPS